MENKVPSSRDPETKIVTGHPAVPPGTRLALFYATTFFVIGIYMPFWPAWLSSNGLGPTEIGILLSITTWTRVVMGPLVAQAADRLGRRKPFMIGLGFMTLVTFFLFTYAGSFFEFAAISFLLGCSFAPMIPLAETTTLSVAAHRGLDYGRIRLWGSLTFIAASWGGGLWLAGRTENAILPLLLVGSVSILFACLVLPDVQFSRIQTTRAPIRRLLRSPVFVLFLAAAGLIQGSHAAFYGFSTIHWRTIGLSDQIIGLLWAIGVGAEVLLFAVSRAILRHIDVTKLLLIGAAAAIARWISMAYFEDFLILILIQTLHALTFGATHLACLHFIQKAAPLASTTTAQALYSALGLGVASALMMALAGRIYDHHQSSVFLAMAVAAFAGGTGALILQKKWHGGQLWTS